MQHSAQKNTFIATHMCTILNLHIIHGTHQVCNIKYSWHLNNYNNEQIFDLTHNTKVLSYSTLFSFCCFHGMNVPKIIYNFKNV
jgi:hypothetical protein